MPICVVFPHRAFRFFWLPCWFPEGAADEPTVHYGGDEVQCVSRPEILRFGAGNRPKRSNGRPRGAAFLLLVGAGESPFFMCVDWFGGAACLVARESPDFVSATGSVVPGCAPLDLPRLRRGVETA